MDLEFAKSLIVESPSMELSWYCLHTNVGPILLGVINGRLMFEEASEDEDDEGI